jgi:hypothetical protein
MAPDYLAPLRAEILWLAARKTSVEGRACREYHVTTESGLVLMSARAFTWSRTIEVGGVDPRASFAIERSRAFPLTGKASVRANPSGPWLGTVSRSGTFRDAAGVIRGRFLDARSLPERARESLFQGVMDALLIGDGESVPSGPDAFVLRVGEAVEGVMSYGRLPFGSAEDTAASEPARTQFVPKALREVWQSLNAPRGWRFVRTVPVGGDPRLQLAAAIFAAELSRW